MIRKYMTLCAVAAAALAFTGCSSVQVAKNFNGEKITPVGTPVAHVSATNCGLYLLWIPLITGSAENVGSPAFLQDDVNTTALAGMVTKQAKQENASNVIDLVTSNNSFGLLFYWRTTYASGNAVK